MHCAPLQEERLPSQGTPKQEKTTSYEAENLSIFDMVEKVGAIYRCPYLLQIALPWEDQMNLPNSCSRILIEHSNVQACFFSYTKATPMRSRKPLYFETLFFGAWLWTTRAPFWCPRNSTSQHLWVTFSPEKKETQCYPYKQWNCPTTSNLNV